MLFLQLSRNRQTRLKETKNFLPKSKAATWRPLRHFLCANHRTVLYYDHLMPLLRYIADHTDNGYTGDKWMIILIIIRYITDMIMGWNQRFSIFCFATDIENRGVHGIQALTFHLIYHCSTLNNFVKCLKNMCNFNSN